MQTRQAFAAIVPEWKAILAEGVRGNNLLNDPTYISLRLDNEPRINPFVVTVRSGGHLRAIAPFYFCHSQFVLQLSVLRLTSMPARILKMAGDDVILTPHANPHDCLTAIFEQICRYREQFGYILFERLAVPGVLWDFCQANVLRSGRSRFFSPSTATVPIHQIRLPASHDQYMASLGS